jgi:ParB family chromosome partitioning protein
MAARTKARAQRPAKKPAAAARSARRAGGARKRLTPRADKRGVSPAEARVALDAPELAPLVAEVERAGGAALGAYREPLSGRALLLAALPIESIEPTPFQRDLSPTHVKRLARKIEESGAFLDPLIVVRGLDGRLWTPNGRHRLAAAKLLGLRQVTGLVSPDEALAFKILALNTEKAHNLRDRSLEVIRMGRELARRAPRSAESEHALEFEEPHLLTLGVVYEKEPRFAGGAYGPFLRKVDRFSEKPLPASLRRREDAAARLREIDAQVVRCVEALRARGFRSPYLRNLVVARVNPVRFLEAKRGDTRPPMELGPALLKMTANLRKFDPAKVREQDLALVAAMSGGEAGD